MKFLSIIVILSLVLCVVYGFVAVYFQASTGFELSPTLTDKWFTVFGIELLATAVIQITKTIVSHTQMKNKIEFMKKNGVKPNRSDFGNSNAYEYSDSYLDENYDNPVG